MKKQTPEPDTKLTIRFPVHLVAKLKTIAAARNVSAQSVLIEAFLDYEKKQPADLRKALDLVSTESKKHTVSD
jgi:hypothetical protein